MPIYEVRHGGKTTKFAVANPNDVVQKHFVAGRFYERDWLDAHRRLIAPRAVIADVGANVGNHALYYASCTPAARVYCFEPNPVAQALLRENVALNALGGTISLEFLDYACGSRRGRFALGKSPRDNLGNTRIISNCTGIIEVAPLDELLPDIAVSFLKVDVEGMELAVLEGAARLIERCHPVVAVEVENGNIAGFWRWCEAARYHVLDAFRMYPANINYLCISKAG